MSRFHGLKAVAELKLKENDVTTRLKSCFHGLKAVAELKRGPDVKQTFTITYVSTASKPWPN